MKLEQILAMTDKLIEIRRLQEEVYEMAIDDNSNDISVCESAFEPRELILFHVFKGLDQLAELLVGPNYNLTIVDRGSMFYPIEKAFIYNGVRYFQLCEKE